MNRLDWSIPRAAATLTFGSVGVRSEQVLEGRRATFFGASSMTGTIRFVSNKPDATPFDARVSVRGAGLDGGSPERRVAAAVVTR